MEFSVTNRLDEAQLSGLDEAQLRVYEGLSADQQLGVAQGIEDGLSFAEACRQAGVSLREITRYDEVAAATRGAGIFAARSSPAAREFMAAVDEIPDSILGDETARGDARAPLVTLVEEGLLV